MKEFQQAFMDYSTYIENERKPEFNNLLKVLKRERPSRPTLFEFFLNEELHDAFTSKIKYEETDPLSSYKKVIDAFRIAGYDYVTMHGSDFKFETKRHKKQNQASVSMNEGAVIFDNESFQAYHWPNPDNYDYSRLEKLAGYLPDGMKIIVFGPDGVLENVVSLVGYENLCYMLVDDPDLVQKVFDAVGSIMVKYYEICAGFDSVGALISNDDWGFNTQTFLTVEDMRKYVVPWHKRIAETIHAAGKPAILHSCGKLGVLFDDIIDVIKYDAKHSYEDKIYPVEQAYEKYSDRIAILGGIDVDFICRSTPEQIYSRSCSLLEMAGAKGGYALGSGNTIPYYVPARNYLSMIAAAVI